MSVRVKDAETRKGVYQDGTRSRASAEYQRVVVEVIIKLRVLYNVLNIVLREIDEMNTKAKELLNTLREVVKKTLGFLNNIRKKYEERMEEEAKRRELELNLLLNLLRDIMHTEGPVALAKAVEEVVPLLKKIGLKEFADSLEELARELKELKSALLPEKQKKTFQKVLNKLSDDKAKRGARHGNNSSNALKQAVGSGVGVWPKGRLMVEVIREDNGEGVQGVEVEINGEVSRTDKRGVVVKEVDYGSKVRVVVRDTMVGDVVYVVERWEVEGGRAVCERNACTLEVSGNVRLRAYVKIVRVAG